MHMLGGTAFLAGVLQHALLHRLKHVNPWLRLRQCHSSSQSFCKSTRRVVHASDAALMMSSNLRPFSDHKKDVSAIQLYARLLIEL